MDKFGYTELARDVAATQIPSGQETTLAAGTPVQITQSLGGTFTVHAIGEGSLFRIKGDDADALGLDKPEAHQMVEGPYDEAKVWEQLRNCYDPEIPVNIVDLGLIYSLTATDDADTPGKRISVQMTLTAPGCGMGPSLAADAEQRILTVPGVGSAHVEVVWDPPWSPERISAAGRDRLGME
jgi:probable FeS assembly SUF system protein SufT